MFFGSFAESQSKVFNEAIDEEESTEDYGYLSDSDLEDGEDDKDPLPNPTSKSKVRPLGFAGEDRIVCEGHEERVERGKVVKIPDMAFVTSVEVDNAFIVSLITL